jgi:hypothetical protein
MWVWYLKMGTDLYTPLNREIYIYIIIYIHIYHKYIYIKWFLEAELDANNLESSFSGGETTQKLA